MQTKSWWKIQLFLSQLRVFVLSLYRFFQQDETVKTALLFNAVSPSMTNLNEEAKSRKRKLSFSETKIVLLMKIEVNICPSERKIFN